MFLLILTLTSICFALQPGELQALQDIFTNVKLNSSQSYLSACSLDFGGICWFSNNDPCCNGNTSCTWIGITCSTSGSISGVDISSYGLQAQFDWEPFTRLPELQNIAISDNFFTGTISPSVGNLTQLQSLQAYNNLFTGPIPKEIGNLSALYWLDLAKNHLNGSIPDEITQLTQLYTLRLPQNNLTGVIPSNIGLLTSLDKLDLSNNPITGSIPDSIGQLVNLQYLGISDTLISGPITNNISFLTSINKILLRDNFLTGNLPQNISLLSQLTFLDLSGNLLSGPVPNSIYWLQSLSALDLSHNNFSGYLSSTLYQVAYGGSLALIDFTGNLQMHSPDYSVPSWLVVNEVNQNTNDNRIFYCAGVHLEFALIPVGLSPEYFNYSLCKCARGYVGIPPNCTTCPPNSNCSEGGSTFYWEQGYYPVFDERNSVVAALPCQFSEFACCPLGSCEANWGGPVVNSSLCLNGTAGRFCSKCLCPPGAESQDECWFDSGNGRCEKCIPLHEWKTIAAATCSTIIAVVVTLVIIAALRRKNLSKAKTTLFTIITSLGDNISSGTVKILLTYAQTTSFLNFDAKVKLFVKWKQVLSPTNIEINSLGIVCAFEQLQDPSLNLIAYLLVPVFCFVIVLVLGVLWKIAIMFKKNRRSSSILLDQDHESIPLATPYSTVELASFTPTPFQFILRWTLSILYFFYFGLANRTFSVFSCVQEQYGIVSYVQSIPWMNCSTPEWTKLSHIAIAGIIVYVVGIPILFSICLLAFRNKKKEESVRYWMGINLYYCYTDENFWFEMVVLLRRLLLAIALSLIDFHSSVRVTFIGVILLTSLMIQFRYQPYKRKSENIYEEVCLMLLLFSYMATLGVNYAVSESLANQIILWLVIVSNALAIGYGLIVIIRDFVVVVRQLPKSIKNTK